MTLHTIEKRFAMIPARGGSKRIPLKNIKEFLGHPLIYYSIKAALESELFEHVIVSTDSEEIAEIAKNLGAEIPFLREKKLADDFTGTGDVTKDAYRRMKALGFDADTVCTVYATAPLLNGEYLKKAYQQFKNEKADYLYACCEFPFPIQRAQFLDENKIPTPVMPQYMSWRSQDLPKTYQDAGLFYFYSKNYFVDPQTAPLSLRGFEMPRHRVIDIDTKEDWDYAQAMVKAVNELHLN
ncbi:MAG: pseudaminic acid cytidylyltransferase [Succinatimonas sp.]|nr:pseudaminic acid cytidylyltransferase [Succinatimonas sp.]